MTREERHSYKIIYSVFSGYRKNNRNLLIIMVGPPGFEPGTSCTPNRTPGKSKLPLFMRLK